MTILGFTTSTDFSSIALFSKGKLVKPLSWTRKEQQSEALTLYIKNYLKKNKVELQDLNLIAVDRGPGSFTGCRIAVNVAKTLAFDLGIPIFASNSLDIMAYGALQKFSKSVPFTAACILDAHRSLFYFRKYQVSENSQIVPENSIQALSLEGILSHLPDQGPVIVLGNLKKDFFESLKTQILEFKPEVKLLIPKMRVDHFPQAEFLVTQALKSENTAHVSWSDVEPAYIRSPDAVEKFLQPK